MFRQVVVAMLCLVVAPTNVAACPFCLSSTGSQVRAVIAQDFGANVATLAAPFVLVLLIVSWGHGAWVDRMGSILRCRIK
jgi:hypothetical protein